MKTKTLAILKFITLITFLVFLSCHHNDKENIDANNDIASFIGQWSFDIGTRTGVPGSVGWLKVWQEEEYIDGELLWGGGGINYVPYLYQTGGVLVFGRPPRRVVLTSDLEGNPLRSRDYPRWVEIQIDGEELTGYLLSPKPDGLGIDSVVLKGTRLPDVPPAPDLTKLKFGEPIELIKNPNDLTGWSLIEENWTNGWSVENGILINDAVQVEGSERIRYGNLKTNEEFEDFNLTLETKVPPRGNSGIYLRGMYEVQVSDSYGRPLSTTGSIGAIYSRIAPVVNMERPAGEWQTMDITFVDQHVTVKLNGVIIIDNQPVYGPTGGAIKSDIFAPGPIYLQGDHTDISFRNIVITPIIN